MTVASLFPLAIFRADVADFLPPPLVHTYSHTYCTTVVCWLCNLSVTLVESLPIFGRQGISYSPAMSIAIKPFIGSLIAGTLYLYFAPLYVAQLPHRKCCGNMFVYLFWFYLIYLFLVNLNSCWQLCRYLSVSHTRQIIYFLCLIWGGFLLLTELTSWTLHPKERLLSDRFGNKYLHKKNTFDATGLWFIYRFKLCKYSNNNRKNMLNEPIFTNHNRGNTLTTHFSNQ